MSGLNSSLTCDYDAYGRLSRTSLSDASGYDVVYDDRGEVAAATVAGHSETHAYDFIGNEFDSNCLNQPEYASTGVSVWYDANGRAIVHYVDAAMPALYLTYDAMHRIVSASLLAEPNTLVQSNVYDNVGRRVMKYAPDGVHRYYYYGKRYYSPALRRWLTRDPIGEEGGVNLYGFCENRPIHFHDEIGCIAVKYVAWQDNGWFVKLFSGEAMSLIEVSSAEEIPIVIKTLNLNGAFSVAPSFVNDCEMQVLLQVVLSDQLKDKAQRGERFSVKPHDNNGGGGVSFSLLGGRSTYGAIKAHELGHAQAFFESTIKNFENKAAAYLSKNRLSEKEKLKVVSLFYEAYNEDISESGRRASLREKFWYEGNGFNIIDKEDHYEAVFR